MGMGEGRLVHRLDRDVSGALLMARSPEAAAMLSAAFRAPAQSLAGAGASQKPGEPWRLHPHPVIP
jgi:RNA pseudouridylate synthase